jgi:mono/diheme cytochrome c family protein
MPFPALKPRETSMSQAAAQRHSPARQRAISPYPLHIRAKPDGKLNGSGQAGEKGSNLLIDRRKCARAPAVQTVKPFKHSSHADLQAMQPFKTTLIALAASLFVAPSAFAIDNNETATGDAAYGRRLAIRWCSSCHQVTADQQRSKAGAPPFTTIAQSPGFNGDRLARLMLSPHPNMAKLALSRTAVDDIAAYILSLKK